MDNFHELIVDTINQIQYLIDHDNERPDFMQKKQLVSLISELRRMDITRHKGDFYPYYPKGIADQWYAKTSLEERLMDILRIYNEFKD